MSSPSLQHAFTNNPIETPTQEHRYVCLDVYLQPHSTHQMIELGWTPVISVPTNRSASGVMETSNGIMLVENRPEHSYAVEGKHVLSPLSNLCINVGLPPTALAVAAASETSQPVGLQQEILLGPLTSLQDVKIPCRFSATDGSIRCQVRLFENKPAPENNSLLALGGAFDAVSPVPQSSSPATHSFHSQEEVAAIIRPSLADKQRAMRERVKGLTDRSRICKELRNAVPAHLKKRKNRRAVIKTLQDLEEYMGSIDPVFEECGNTAEFCMTAARTIGLSNTRFTELRRMWEAYQAEIQAENHEILELAPHKDTCTLRKLVAILERYGWSCTSGQPRSSEDISKPPRPPTMIESPSWIGALRKRPSLTSLSTAFDSDDFESDFSPKKPRSEYSEEGNTSDEGELFSAPDTLFANVFEPKPTTPQSFMEDNFFLPTWAPRDSNASDPPNITFDVPDVDIFNEIEKQILAEFL